MSCEKIKKDMRIMFSADYIKRITIEKTQNGLIYIDVDLHGLTCKQAQRFVRNVIIICRGNVVFDFIHGFNHGTKIKRMIMETKWTSRDTKCSCPSWNPGLTVMKVAA